ncbi:MAG TPA: alpha/beta fold hydrolase [Caulobacteraceae bacterium]|nr:alpha/beta fold hydrolase [Caulobacteraceae bacterium]
MAAIYHSAAGEAALKATYGGFLQHWPVPHETLRLPTRQGETFVIASGDPAAPPLVLLHGSGSNATSWMGDIAAWSAAHRVYAIDVIGEPGFSAPSRPPYAGEAYAEWLDDVLQGLGVEAATFVGMSLGGWFSLDYAICRPGRVRALVLVCPAGLGRGKGGFRLKAWLMLAMGEGGRRRAARDVFAKAGLPQAYVDYMTLVFTHFRPRPAVPPAFPDAQLSGLTAPVMLVVGGRDDLLDSAESRDRLARARPDARIVFLPEAGHVIHGQTPAMLAFLEEVGA